MSKIIDIFLEITKIPRCSFHTQEMEEYITKKAKEYGYIVQVDSAKNVLVSSKEPKICLQAHYDMVCVGDAPDIEPVIEGNILKAKNSSLGADNGIAIAMMLRLMQEGTEAEFLFTNDEEVGLIGAGNLELNINSKYLLNLDSEDEQEVYIGCAGGVDLKLSKELQSSVQDGYFYELSISGLPGGHSGVDIDKNIPNAIVELAKYIKSNACSVATFSGGERINSIPVNAKAIVCSQSKLESKLESNDLVKVKEVSSVEVSNFNIQELTNMPNGVLELNEEFGVVQSSCNLALVNTDEKSAKVEISYRSLNNSDLENITKLAKEAYELLGYKVELNDKYPGWSPETNDFTKLVQNAVSKVYGSYKTKVIHAGLECGLLSQNLPNIKMASIGPNIRFPHSIREYVEIDSVDRTYEVVKEVVDACR